MQLIIPKKQKRQKPATQTTLGWIWASHRRTSALPPPHLRIWIRTAVGSPSRRWAPPPRVEATPPRICAAAEGRGHPALDSRVPPRTEATSPRSVPRWCSPAVDRRHRRRLGPPGCRSAPSPRVKATTPRIFLDGAITASWEKESEREKLGEMRERS